MSTLRLLPIATLIAAIFMMPLVVLSAEPQAASRVAGAADAVTSKVEVDKPVILLGDAGPVYVLVRFAAPDGAPGKKRPRLNLSLVLDRSGSMESKGKLEYLKQAAKQVVDSLKSDDRLSIIEYDDRVSVLWPSSPVESTAMVKRLIDGLTPRNSTDLAGGLVAGIEQVQGHVDEEALNRVLLLSDGLANVGVTDPREIRKLVRKGKMQGVRVSAIGLGLDYNEDLMQDIAESAGGNYYYVESPGQMAGIFERELQTLFKTTARDIGFTFEAGAGVRGVEVYGYAAETQKGQTEVELADFFAGENRSLLLRLDVDADRVGPLKLGTLKFTYHDVVADTERRIETALSVDVSRDPGAVDEAANKTVIIEAALVEAERRHADAVGLYENGRMDEAKATLRETAASLAAMNPRLDDVRITKKIEALNVESTQMDVYAAAPEAARAMYRKRTKQRLYQAQSGRRGLYMVQPGDTGHEVERLQKALGDAGYYKGPTDGTYNPALGNALEAYQRSQSLPADGIAGPATLERLNLY